MPSSLALFLWLVLLLALWRFDPAKDPSTSLALWVPLIWMFIVGSRLPSQWLGMQAASVATALEEGNPLDRAIWSVLILLAIWILASRSFRWSSFFASNLFLMAFLAFALVSVLWSDFPLIALKRWLRDVGSYLVILVVLSDSRPLEAVRTLLRRVCYLLVPLSVLLIRYYRDVSVLYDPWSGQPEYVGPTTSKNSLGVLCLVSGLFFFWDTVTRWSNRREPRTRRIIIINLAFIAMSLWLLGLSNSVTSRVCLVIGFLTIALAHSGLGKRHPGFVNALIPATFFLYLIVAFGFGMNGEMAQAVGRNADLTGRTVIWPALLSMHTNPLLGTGYESFWLGPRLEWLWQKNLHVNEAHNGYLEVYLNLGLIGLALLVGFLISSYRTICKRLAPFSPLGSLGLALWIALLFRSMTEASFRCGLMWLTFLLGAVTVPLHAGGEELSPAEKRYSESLPPICVTR
jgi:O-antigen ligase